MANHETKPNKSDVEYASNLYKHVISISQDWRNIDEVKAKLIIEYSKDAIESFGKTNQEKKVKLREIIEKAEQIISPESVDSLKKRAEKLFLRFIYPKNLIYRNVLLACVSILILVGLSLSIISSVREFFKSSDPVNSQANTSNTASLISTSNTDASRSDKFPAGKAMGVDVSDANGEIDWFKVDKSSVSFAVVKATEGATFTSKHFQQNWNSLKRVGIIRGAYHYFNTDIDATTQANYFSQVVHLELGDLPPILYIEESPNAKKPIVEAVLINEVKKWLRVVEQNTGRKPIILTGHFWNEYMTDEFGDYPLWIVQYPDALSAELPKTEIPKNRLPKGWGTWTFWNFSDGFPIEGLERVDASLFNGSYDDLKTFISNH